MSGMQLAHAEHNEQNKNSLRKKPERWGDFDMPNQIFRDQGPFTQEYQENTPADSPTSEPGCPLGASNIPNATNTTIQKHYASSKKHTAPHTWASGGVQPSEETSSAHHRQGILLGRRSGGVQPPELTSSWRSGGVQPPEVTSSRRPGGVQPPGATSTRHPGGVRDFDPAIWWGTTPRRNFEPGFWRGTTPRKDVKQATWWGTTPRRDREPATWRGTTLRWDFELAIWRGTTRRRDFELHQHTGKQTTPQATQPPFPQHLRRQLGHKAHTTQP
jgi:hypothetical protein